MFDILPNLLSSIASFLFPLFASYKALKSTDPSQLRPWLMYWVVLAVALLVESWTYWILGWVPFYAYLRLSFLLYLVLPQTQGARYLYITYVHPFLQENEVQIEQFIATSHERMKDAGLNYLKVLINMIRTQVFGLPPEEPAAPPPSTSATNAQSYTQNLLARFNIPTPRNAGSDFYNLLASAVSAAANSSAFSMAGASASPTTTEPADSTDNIASSTSTLIPPSLTNTAEKMTFIAAQRERLAFMLSALDREARQIQTDREDGLSPASSRVRSRVPSAGNASELHDDFIERPPSGLSGWSGISKSRSETDFEKIDADSGTEEDQNLRRRNNAAGASTSGSWIPWGWGPQDTTHNNNNASGSSTGADRS